ncbi:proprotein convertase P-domain-containing protein [Egbenema bharatensis]|uniref:proprotein convertase P-domain-containing protein n=1 Tax=Egbenema bharatensis TaxID=3463334 RepID=UPI003A87106B
MFNAAQFNAAQSNAAQSNAAQPFPSDPSASDSFPHHLLHRGGESLQVEPLPDRFTVALTPEGAIDRLLHQLIEELGPEAVKVGRVIPRVGTELWVQSGFLETLKERAWASREVLSASPIYQLSHHPGAPIYLSNQLTILFSPSVTSEQMQAITAHTGLRAFKLIPGVPKAFVFQVMPQEREVNPILLSQQVMRHPEVLLAEPNIVVDLRSSAPSAAASPQNETPDLHSAWQYIQGHPSIVIAVAESMVDSQQPVFQAGGKIVAPLLEGVNGDAEGTGQESGIGRVARIAPECSLMPIAIGSFLDDAIVEQICEGVIEQEAAVLLCEWGASLEHYPLSLRQQAAFTRAATKGSSGGCVIGFVDWGEHRLNGFAIHPDVLTIAAHPFTQQRANPHGARISVCAPRGIEDEVTAGAIVSGIAALVRSANPDLTAKQVKQLLQTTADKVIAANSAPDSSKLNWSYDPYGYAQPVGYGQVNPLRAIEAALPLSQTLPELTPSASLHWIEQAMTTPLDIPDGDPQGVLTAITIPDTRAICQIEVSLEIEHSFMGDLEIYLIPPNRIPLLLQSRTAGRIHILRKTYTFSTTPSLKTLLSQPAKGSWQLHLIDRVPEHTGRLKRWSLKLGV